jgi:probable F420-dependent oxidoreductase
MRLGMNILNFGPGAHPATFERAARLAEGLGLSFALISDHVAVTPDVEALYPAPFYDPFVLLAWLTGLTRTIELGTTVTILPYRHPLQTARMAANIDQLSGGRFILGAGVGWAKQEFAALGVPFEHRGAIANEYLDVIRKCWTADVVSHAGRWVSFPEVYTAPRPVRAPHPPIWVGGSSDAAIRRAVRYGTAWHPIRSRMDWLENEGLPKLRRFAEEEHRAVPAFCPRIHLHLTDAPARENRLPGEGTLEQVREDLDELESLGAESVTLDTFDGKPQSTLHPEKGWAMLARLVG